MVAGAYATQENLIQNRLSKKPGYRAELLDLLTEIGQQVNPGLLIVKPGWASTGFFARSDVNAYFSIKLHCSAHTGRCALSLPVRSGR